MVAVFFVFRMRFYAAWCGAEASCISAGLGCYPEKSVSKPGGGPTVDYRYSKTRPAGVSHEGALTNCLGKVLYLIYLFVSGLFVIGTTSALIPPRRSRTTSEPFRTSTATTPTSAWRCDTACATGTWRCSGGCITTSTLTPPSGPTLWGETPPVQVFSLVFTSVWWSCIWTGCGRLHEMGLGWLQGSTFQKTSYVKHSNNQIRDFQVWINKF